MLKIEKLFLLGIAFFKNELNLSVTILCPHIKEAHEPPIKSQTEMEQLVYRIPTVPFSHILT